jgi:fluoride exporter
VPQPDRSAERGPDTVIDSDVDLHDARQRQETSPHEWDLIAATAAGGIIGAEARYGLARAIPHSPDAFPWSTLLVNVTGCLLIGVLMVVLLELITPHRLLRPFLGVGVLGGFTTYSTFAVDVQQLVLAHRPGIAIAYGVLTVLACIAAVWLAGGLTRALARTRSAEPSRSPA